MISEPIQGSPMRLSTAIVLLKVTGPELRYFINLTSLTQGDEENGTC